VKRGLSVVAVVSDVSDVSIVVGVMEAFVADIEMYQRGQGVRVTYEIVSKQAM
jgi:hypothetical protein